MTNVRLVGLFLFNVQKLQLRENVFELFVHCDAFVKTDS